ncbi:Lrp/AsnC family transcriptional regulator [Burkholderia metallica]|uniref:Lrp/AsnC family transcriptional regulator n=1 Tax=Burkholderia metallica TaxID=488729 RepID=UPI000841BE35|nr:Lrp/AsnC family transcriptional regulator [Burkholderia metallica]AOJ31859.1 AsnC family transcriptional regulator [Burkholderia metallica]MCA7999052.1 Lrp/AsnC family transcriptional regulator [Burkholderia metallica]
MKRGLDRVDTKILSLLTEKARLSHNVIAMSVNLSRNAVRLRIERLERDGYIRGYTIRHGSPEADSAPIRALMFIYRKDRMRGGEVIAYVRTVPEVVACDVMSGELDVLLHIEATSPERIHKLWEEVAALQGVLDTVTSFVLTRSKDSRSCRTDMVPT